MASNEGLDPEQLERLEQAMRELGEGLLQRCRCVLLKVQAFEDKLSILVPPDTETQREIDGDAE